MRRYESKLTRYAIYLIHDEALAQDIVQETFIKTYRNLRSYNNKYKFSSWIYRIAHNESINAVKHEKQHSSVDVETIGDESYEPTTVKEIDLAIMKSDVKACLDGIDIKYREVLLLQYYENMKYGDISDVLHVPVSTVGVWALRAKAQLQRVCQKKGVQP
jgi:RNA polymerase sigma-70 factor (ECF subfamily)